jgi:HNH endonuclease
MNLIARMLKYTERNEETGCWEWIGYTDGYGYGMIRVDGKMRGVHRVSHELHHGPIPPGLNVLHKCDVPRCWNPQHIWAGTQQENMVDMYRKGRRKLPKGEGHPQSRLTEEQIHEIRDKVLLKGRSKLSVSREYGVSDVTIGKIATFKKWGHVPLKWTWEFRTGQGGGT